MVIIEVCLAIAAICTTLVPVIYAFSPWYRSALGRAFMVQAIAFALVLDGTWFAAHVIVHDPELILAVNMLIFLLVAGATFSVAFMIWKINHYHVLHRGTDTTEDEKEAQNGGR